MISIDLFPTKVCLFDYTDKEVFKTKFNETYGDKKFYDVGEQTGQNKTHHDGRFESFYQFVVTSVSDYLKSLNVNTDNFYIVIAKSWMSFVNKENNVPVHNHSDHHLSFTYYVDMPEGSCNVIGFNDKRQNLNEPFYGAFNLNMGSPPNISSYNQYNTGEFILNLKEGQLCVFPSKLDHFVPSGNFLNERKCIAGDILLIYKDVDNKNPWGMYPQENWKYYETKMD